MGKRPSIDISNHILGGICLKLPQARHLLIKTIRLCSPIQRLVWCLIVVIVANLILLVCLIKAVFRNVSFWRWRSENIFCGWCWWNNVFTFYDTLSSLKVPNLYRGLLNRNLLLACSLILRPAIVVAVPDSSKRNLLINLDVLEVKLLILFVVWTETCFLLCGFFLETCVCSNDLRVLDILTQWFL